MSEAGGQGAWDPAQSDPATQPERPFGQRSPLNSQERQKIIDGRITIRWIDIKMSLGAYFRDIETTNPNQPNLNKTKSVITSALLSFVFASGYMTASSHGALVENFESYSLGAFSSANWSNVNSANWEIVHDNGNKVLAIFCRSAA
jgi:hypothetical protein